MSRKTKDGTKMAPVGGGSLKLLTLWVYHDSGSGKLQAGEVIDTIEKLPARVNLILFHYLAGVISLSRAAELLNLHQLDLQARFMRLDIPLRLGGESLETISEDVKNAADFTSPTP